MRGSKERKNNGRIKRNKRTIGKQKDEKNNERTKRMKRTVGKSKE